MQGHHDPFGIYSNADQREPETPMDWDDLVNLGDLTLINDYLDNFAVSLAAVEQSQQSEQLGEPVVTNSITEITTSNTEENQNSSSLTTEAVLTIEETNLNQNVFVPCFDDYAFVLPDLKVASSINNPQDNYLCKFNLSVLAQPQDKKLTLLIESQGQISTDDMHNMLVKLYTRIRDKIRRENVKNVLPTGIILNRVKNTIVISFEKTLNAETGFPLIDKEYITYLVSKLTDKVKLTDRTIAEMQNEMNACITRHESYLLTQNNVSNNKDHDELTLEEIVDLPTPFIETGFLETSPQINLVTSPVTQTGVIENTSTIVETSSIILSSEEEQPSPIETALDTDQLVEKENVPNSLELDNHFQVHTQLSQASTLLFSPVVRNKRMNVDFLLNDQDGETSLDNTIIAPTESDNDETPLVVNRKRQLSDNNDDNLTVTQPSNPFSFQPTSSNSNTTQVSAEPLNLKRLFKVKLNDQQEINCDLVVSNASGSLKGSVVLTDIGSKFDSLSMTVASKLKLIKGNMKSHKKSGGGIQPPSITIDLNETVCQNALNNFDQFEKGIATLVLRGTYLPVEKYLYGEVTTEVQTNSFFGNATQSDANSNANANSNSNSTVSGKVSGAKQSKKSRHT